MASSRRIYLSPRQLKYLREELWLEIVEQIKELPAIHEAMPYETAEEQEEREEWEAELAEAEEDDEEDDGRDEAQYESPPDDEEEFLYDQEEIEKLGLLPKARDCFQRVAKAVSEKNLEELREAWEDLGELNAEHSDLLPSELHDDVQDLIEQIDDVTPVPIFNVPQGLSREQAQIVAHISTFLAQLIAKEPLLLYKLSPREFEEFIADVFASLGYRVELTAQTRDGGKDLIAIRKESNVLTKLLVECKRYAAHRTVGLSHVRELYGVKTIENATKAFLVTTSWFSRDARLLEKQLIYEIELKDFDAVSQWARNYSNFLNHIRTGFKP